MVRCGILVQPQHEHLCCSEMLKTLKTIDSPGKLMPPSRYQEPEHFTCGNAKELWTLIEETEDMAAVAMGFAGLRGELT